MASKGGRPATGQVEWRSGKNGVEAWHVRVTLSKTERPWVAIPSIAREDEATARIEGERISTRMRERGAVRKTAGKTVSEWFKDWAKDRRANGVSTTNDERGRFTKWIEPVLGAKEIARVPSDDLEALVAALDTAVRAERITWKTAGNVWGIVTKMFDDACRSKNRDLRVRKDNPAKDVRGPDRGVDRTKPFLRSDELVALFSCPDVPLHRRHVYAAAAYTAVRVSELRALTPADVSFEAGQVSVAKQHDGRVLKKRTKTRRARVVTIEPALESLLRVLVATPEGRDGRLLRVPHESECSSLLRADLRVAGCQRADLYADDDMRAPIVFHNLRHTCGVHMAARRDAPQDVQWRLGHTTAAMSEKYISEARYATGPNFGAPFPELPPEMLTTAGPFRHRKGIGENGPPDQDQIPAGWGASPTGFEEAKNGDKSAPIATKIGPEPFPAETPAMVGEPSSMPHPKPEDPDAALRDAIKAAVDAGLFERARALLDVLAKTSEPAVVVDLRDRRRE